jgi:alkylated DNA nucleotide flippase Atl1
MQNTSLSAINTANMSTRDILFRIVNLIPPGKVCSYGQVGYFTSLLTGKMIRGQVAGWILAGIKDDEVDKVAWQRVVAKNGFIAATKLGARGWIQKSLLENEGLVIPNDSVDMDKYGLTNEELEALLSEF